MGALQEIKKTMRNLRIKDVMLVSAVIVAATLSQLEPVSQAAAADPAAASAAPLAGADKNFVLEAANGGLAEVELAKLAQERGQSQSVKQFAQKMIDDHGKANTELSQLAAKKSVTLPAEPAAKQKAIKEKLAKLSGADFDKQYMAQMCKDHESTVALFKKESKQGKDADLVAWVNQTLPTLEGHLTMSHDIDGQVKKAPKSMDK